MSPDESLLLLEKRWEAVRRAVRECGGDPDANLTRDGLLIQIRILSRARTGADGASVRDAYVFRLHYADYDEHGPRLALCNPDDPKQVGTGQRFYPKLEGNATFNHSGFFCMPGDRRCYESGNHQEWKKKEYFHPDVIIESLYSLLQSPQYRGRI